MFVLCRNEGDAEIIQSHELEISTLAGLSSLKVCDKLYLDYCLHQKMSVMINFYLQILNENDATPAGCKVDVVNANINVYLKVKETINAEVEREKLRKKMEETKR